MKGGTAKTTTAVNLAAYLALAGLRVLLIDLDPQNFATVCLGVETEKVKVSISNVLLDHHNLPETIRRTNVPHLDLIPSDRRLASTDVLLADAPGREKILKERACLVWRFVHLPVGGDELLSHE